MNAGRQPHRGDPDKHIEDKYIEGVRASQSNIVFPDTVRNARSVDAFLWRGSPAPSVVQRIGAWLFGLTFIGCGMGFVLLAAEARDQDHDWVGFGAMVLASMGCISLGIRLFRNGFPRRQKTNSD